MQDLLLRVGNVHKGLKQNTSTGGRLAKCGVRVVIQSKVPSTIRAGAADNFDPAAGPVKERHGEARLAGEVFVADVPVQNPGLLIDYWGFDPDAVDLGIQLAHEPAISRGFSFKPKDLGMISAQRLGQANVFALDMIGANGAEL